MECPKCGGAFETVEHGEVEFDRCASCNGLWFDAFEHEALKADPRAEDVDTAPVKPALVEGTKLCPRCSVKMIDMVVAAQPHIRYESCGVCHGVYFDAGEFRDFREESFGETVRAVLRAARGH